MEIPKHLQKYIVSQDEYVYTSLEHSTWRYILHRLTTFLSKHGHPSYMDGIKKTGIRLDRIPSIQDISQHLSEFGWVALPVSGFIPPAAFMELQSLGVLPIAREMRTFSHLMYTPAPDIVHEAAGHAPMIVNPEYSDYLKAYASVARRAILSKADLRVYHAIRNLSDLKENPATSCEAIEMAEQELRQAVEDNRFASEATWLSRMNWWTAEYGLIGDLKNPKIYGAGLLSSVGESESCLGPQVKKIPLTIDCIHVSYDITEPQPQLFVTPNFEYLSVVLEELKNQMAFVRGGILGVQRALSSEYVCSVRLDSGIEVGGVLNDCIWDKKGDLSFLRWKGPVQLAYQEQEISGHGVTTHSEGFSLPLGQIVVINGKKWESVGYLGAKDLEALGWKPNQKVDLEYASGFKFSGELVRWQTVGGASQSCIVTFKQACLRRGDEIFFHPEWGQFDLVFGTQVTSVWGGAPDRSTYPMEEDFYAVRVQKSWSKDEQERFPYFDQVQKFYQDPNDKNLQLRSYWEKLDESYRSQFGSDPLWAWELERILKQLPQNP